MTRRGLLLMAAVPTQPLILPVHLIIDTKSKPWPGRLELFWSRIWPEAVRDLRRCGIQIAERRTNIEMEKPSQREPIISKLAHGVLNLVVTDQIPMYWDHGRSLNGVTLLYRGHHVSMIALNWAHAHRIPLLSVNTCLHEILHALLGDILERKPPAWRGEAREMRVDAVATRMWLFGDGSGVREPARRYVEKLALPLNSRASR